MAKKERNVCEECQSIEARIQTLETEVKNLESRDEKDLQYQLQNMKNYLDIDAKLIERQVTSAVADHLKDAIIIKSSRYEYQSFPTDLDGLVAGLLENQQVIVFCESKHNMNNNYNKAKTQLLNTLKNWETLAAATLDDLNEDPNLKVDYDELQVETYRNHKPIFAFGAIQFSDAIQEKHFTMAIPTLFVIPNADCLMCVLD